MSKVCTYYLLMSVTLIGYFAVTGLPTPQDAEELTTIATVSNPAHDEFMRRFREFQEKSRRHFEEAERKAGIHPLSELDVKHLKKDGNSHVFAETQSYHHSSSNINGHKTEEHGGHKVVNDDGKVSEYDLA